MMLWGWVVHGAVWQFDMDSTKPFSSEASQDCLLATSLSADISASADGGRCVEPVWHLLSSAGLRLWSSRRSDRTCSSADTPPPPDLRRRRGDEQVCGLDEEQVCVGGVEVWPDEDSGVQDRRPTDIWDSRENKTIQFDNTKRHFSYECTIVQTTYKYKSIICA